VSYPCPTRVNPVFTRINSSKPWVCNGFVMKTLGFVYPCPTRVLPVLTPYFPVSPIWVRIPQNLMFSNHFFHGSDGSNRKFRRQLVSRLHFQLRLKPKLESNWISKSTFAESDGKQMTTARVFQLTCVQTCFTSTVEPSVLFARLLM